MWVNLFLLSSCSDRVALSPFHRARAETQLRLGLYGPFNLAAHFTMPLAQLQSLAKAIYNMLHMVSLATNTALSSAAYCSKNVYVGIHIAREMLSVIISAKFVFSCFFNMHRSLR